jgi:gluconate:H+ symporter, GntP family
MERLAMTGATVGGPLLLLYAAIAIVLLVLLIVRFKLHPFLTLVLVSLLLGLAVRMPMAQIVKSFEAGVGGILGHVALVVTLGTMLGKMMAESGGAERIARTLIAAFGVKNVHWAMMTIALIVGLPVFFEVGFVLLVPIAFNVARRTGTSMVLVGIPMVAGLSVVHGLIPPHPAALLAVAAYQADLGKTIVYSLLVGVPAAAIAGPLFAKLMARHVHPDENNPMAAQFIDRDSGERPLPGFGVTLFTILLPVLLMLVGSGADLLASPDTTGHRLLRFVGDPVVALLLACLVSFYTFGAARGLTRESILKFTNESLAPTAVCLMVVGAGGGFGRILKDSGTAQSIVEIATGAHVSVLLLAWLVAAIIRVATGSATVATVTAAGIIAPIASGIPGVRPELLVLATGAGSLILSHVNDGGFWLVKEYFNMTVPETFKTWTVCETVISVVALVLTLGLSAVL